MADLRAAEKLSEHNRYRPKSVPSNSALLLQFLILTAVRKGQVIDVKWEDLDLDVVPLSRQAIAVIERMRDRHQRLGIHRRSESRFSLFTA